MSDLFEGKSNLAVSFLHLNHVRPLICQSSFVMSRGRTACKEGTVTAKRLEKVLFLEAVVLRLWSQQ